MDVVVTAGGTSEPIDDVRSVTNFSTGRFPVAIAAEFARLGDRVTLLGSAEAVLHAHSRSLPAEKFTSSASLDASLEQAAAAAPDVVIQLAAVSDYVPIPEAGKISSSAAELIVTMRRNVKLIDGFRERFAAHTYLVGAKLTSGASANETIEAGYRLLKRARLSLVIANELSECVNGAHPCWLITAEGGALRLEGTRAEVAANIAWFIRKRQAVHWSQTRTADRADPAREPTRPQVTDNHRALLANMLDFAREASLLPGTDGNAVVRLDEPLTVPALFVTPRQIPKTALVADDGIPVVYDSHNRVTWAWPAPQHTDRKPSIDTSVQARILAATVNVDAILHTHECFGVMDARTTFPYPCGAAEEAHAVIAALEAADIPLETPTLSVELTHHGFLLGVNHETLARIRAEFAAQQALYRTHLDEIGERTGDPVTPGDTLVPVFDGLEVVGVVNIGDSGAAVHLAPQARGRGIGAVIAEQLAERRLPVVTVDACEVIDYWETHGFTAERGHDGIVTLTAPLTASAVWAHA